MRTIPAAVAALAILAPRPALAQRRKKDSAAETAGEVPPPPAQDPPPPPARLPKPPEEAPGWVQRAGSSAAPRGKWLYTTLLGWIWAPRGRPYVDYPAQGDPHTFVYLSTGNWQWIVAPWVWGNWWPYHHRAYQGSGQGWGSATLDRWRHRDTPAARPRSDEEEDDLFAEDGDPFSVDDFQTSDFGPTQWDLSSDGFGDLDFGMGNSQTGPYGDGMAPLPYEASQDMSVP